MLPRILMKTVFSRLRRHVGGSNMCVVSIRLRLDDREFSDLVRGRVVRCWGQRPGVDEAVEVEIVLADIGFLRMLQLIDAAMRPAEPHE